MLALALTLQSLELLLIWQRVHLIWTLELTRREVWWFPSDRIFGYLLWLRLFASLALFLCPANALVWLLIAITLLTAIRFGGSLNGGSDAMTMVVLSSRLVPWGRTYLAVQLTLSYFVAGLVKLRLPEWRNGRALTALTGLPAGLSWPALLWECSFPLAWFCPAPYLTVGALFHLINTRRLGLNRFFWIWLAAYWECLR